jgi:dihydroneopterin aldolase
VVDYNHLRDTVLALRDECPIGLQETVCERLIDRLRSHRGVAGAIVETRKIAIYSDAEGVGCRMASIDPAALAR